MFATFIVAAALMGLVRGQEYKDLCTRFPDEVPQSGLLPDGSEDLRRKLSDCRRHGFSPLAQLNDDCAEEVFMVEPRNAASHCSFYYCRMKAEKFKPSLLTAQPLKFGAIQVVHGFVCQYNDEFVIFARNLLRSDQMCASFDSLKREAGDAPVVPEKSCLGSLIDESRRQVDRKCAWGLPLLQSLRKDPLKNSRSFDREGVSLSYLTENPNSPFPVREPTLMVFRFAESSFRPSSLALYREFLTFSNYAPIVAECFEGSDHLYWVSEGLNSNLAVEDVRCALQEHPRGLRFELYLKMTDAVRELHENGIVHMKLDPQNWMITDDRHPVIANFNSSCRVGDPLKLKVDEVPPVYRHADLRRSEFSERTKCEFKFDLYSLAMTIWLMEIPRSQHKELFTDSYGDSPKMSALPAQASEDFPFFRRLLRLSLDHPLFPLKKEELNLSAMNLFTLLYRIVFLNDPFVTIQLLHRRMKSFYNEFDDEYQLHPGRVNKETVIEKCTNRKTMPTKPADQYLWESWYCLEKAPPEEPKGLFANWFGRRI